MFFKRRGGLPDPFIGDNIVIQHELKTDPPQFQAIRQGWKTYELRLNDRGFEVNNILKLVSFDRQSNRYNNQFEVVRVTYITRGSAENLALGTDYVVMAIVKLGIDETNADKYDLQLASDSILKIFNS